MAHQHCDVLIIGGGPGGISAASKLALQGKQCIIINDGPLMGYGIEGAFRTKAAFEITSEFMHMRYMEDIYDQHVDLTYDMLHSGVDKSSEQLSNMLSSRLNRLHVKIVAGRGSFMEPHRVRVNGDEYSGDQIIIATGTRPRVLPGMPTDSERIITSDAALNLKDTPKSLLILGAGVIGCEFASMFNAVGTQVYLVDTRNHIMSHEDPDISRFLENAFLSRDINVIPSSRYKSMELTENGVLTDITTNTIETEMVLIAVGRSACSDKMNLKVTGIETDKYGYISIDENMQTNMPGFYAVGDIGYRNISTDISLVHVAEAEGRCAAAHILNKKYPQSMDHVPYIIFTVPMLAGAGLSETVAREKCGDIRVGKYPFARNHRAHAMRPPIGFVKLIVGPEGDDRILGVRAIGAGSDSVIGAASIMIERELPYSYLIESMFPHPSLLECLKGAAHIIAGDQLQYEEGEELTVEQVIAKRPAVRPE
jgi:dihydrolipoamide dehydrogenase